jgi:hypothetical protein
VVSHPEVNRRLREFVCVRMDWEQMQRHKSRWPTPTQGNQVLLDSRGDAVAGTDPRGRRHPVPDLLALLDRVLRDHPPAGAHRDDLELEWFLWNPRERGYQGHFGAEAASRLDRKPLLTLSGPVPGWLRGAGFLRRHLRQFIWTRGEAAGPARLAVRMLEPERRELLSLSLADADPVETGRRLDAAWLEYMKVRPLVARGYIDNPFGSWLRAVMERAHAEEVRLREEALKGTLTPPGRE